MLSANIAFGYFFTVNSWTSVPSHSFIFHFGKDRNMSLVEKDAENCKTSKPSMKRSGRCWAFLLSGKALAMHGYLPSFVLV